jgi:hypothetical protein
LFIFLFSKPPGKPYRHGYAVTHFGTVLATQQSVTKAGKNRANLPAKSINQKYKTSFP